MTIAAAGERMVAGETNTFSTLLRQYRSRAGLTQEELAERAQMSVRGLMYLEHGTRRPYPDTLRRLADALALDPAQRDALLTAARSPEIAQRPSGEPLTAERATVNGPSLVGRTRERQMLRDHLAAARAGHGGTVLIGGEAGIGKTTLVESLGIEAAGQGCLVLWGHCYDLSVTPPYGPWLAISRQYAPTDALPPFPAFLRDARALAALGSQERLFADVTAFFVGLADHRPLVIVVDDLHWADTSSLDLLRVLAREAGSHPLLLLATYRTEDVNRRHPLRDLLPLLTREARATRLDVRPLDDAARHALITARYRLPSADGARLESYLRDHAEGNPLYVTELLRTLEDEGMVTEHEGVWQLGDLSQVRMPPLLREVIEGRLGRLSEATQRLLPVAAVIGQEVPLDLWGTAAGADEEAVIETVEEATAAHVLTALPDGTGVRFSHALIREALYEGLLPPRRRIWHRTVAELLELTPQPDPDAVAYQYERAGDGRAIDWLIRAANRAEQRYAWRAAVERFEAAIAAIEALPTPDPIQRCETLLSLGAAQHLAGAEKGAGGAANVPVARETFKRAAEAAQSAASAALLVRAALGYSGIGVAGQGGAPEAALLAEAFAALPEEDSVLRVRVLTRLVEARWWLATRWAVAVPPSWEEWVAEMQGLAQQALAMARRIGAPEGLIAALSCQVIVATGPDAPDHYLAAAQEQIAVAEKIGAEMSVLLGYHWMYLALAQKGDIGGAEAAHRRLAALVGTYQIVYFDWLLAGERATEALRQGHFTEAERLIAEAERLWPNTVVVTQQLFTLRRDQGRAAEVATQASGLRRESLWVIIEALLRLEVSDAPTVRDTIRSLVAQWVRRPQAAEWLRLMSWLAEAVAAVDDAESAALLAEVLAPYAHLNLAMGMSDQTGGAMAYYLGLLARTMRRWAEAEEHFTQAYARNERWGNRPSVARTAYVWAEMLTRRGAAGDDARAGALLDEAARRAEEIGMVVLTQDCRALRERRAANPDE